MKFIIRKALIPATVIALIAAVFVFTPDPLTQLWTFSQIFILTMVVLIVLSRVTKLASWPPIKLRWLIWSVSVGMAALVILEEVAVSLSHH